MDFPSRMPEASTLPDTITKSLNIQPKEIFKSRDYVLVYDSEKTLKKSLLKDPYFDLINLDPGCVVVTAAGTHSELLFLKPLIVSEQR